MNRNARRLPRILALALVAMSLGACHFCGHGWGGWGWGHGHYYHGGGGHGGSHGGGHCR